MQRKAVFLDKDGTLIEDVPYNVDLQLIRLAPHAGDCLAALSRAGFSLIVISNQSGVAEGYFEETALHGVRTHLFEAFASMGASLDDFYYCPHPKVASACDCRKPQPGLLLRAAADHNIDLKESWMVGDIMSDIEAGNLAGCRTILVGNERVPDDAWRDWRRRPYAVCSDLSRVAPIILSPEPTCE